MKGKGDKNAEAMFQIYSKCHFALVNLFFDSSPLCKSSIFCHLSLFTHRICDSMSWRCGANARKPKVLYWELNAKHSILDSKNYSALQSLHQKLIWYTISDSHFTRLSILLLFRFDSWKLTIHYPFNPLLIEWGEKVFFSFIEQWVFKK